MIITILAIILYIEIGFATSYDLEMNCDSTAHWMCVAFWPYAMVVATLSVVIDEFFRAQMTQ